jgi:hypothetical protein
LARFAERNELRENNAAQPDGVATTRQKCSIIADGDITVATLAQLAGNALRGTMVVCQPMRPQDIPRCVNEFFTGTLAKATFELITVCWYL